MSDYPLSEPTEAHATCARNKRRCKPSRTFKSSDHLESIYCGHNAAESQYELLESSILPYYGEYATSANISELDSDLALETLRRQCFQVRKRKRPQWCDGEQIIEHNVLPHNTYAYYKYVDLYYSKSAIALKAAQRHMRAQRERTFSKLATKAKSYTRWAAADNMLEESLPELIEDTPHAVAIAASEAVFDSKVLHASGPDYHPKAAALRDTRASSNRTAGLYIPDSEIPRPFSSSGLHSSAVGPGAVENFDTWLMQLQADTINPPPIPLRPAKKTKKKKRPVARLPPTLSSSADRFTNTASATPRRSTATTVPQSSAVSEIGSTNNNKVSSNAPAPQSQKLDAIPVRPENYECPIVAQPDIACDVQDTWTGPKNVPCALCQVAEESRQPFLNQFLSKSGRNNYRAHKGCVEFSPEVYVDEYGRYVNALKAIRRGRFIKCSGCNVRGATIGCSVETCNRSYHLQCAERTGWRFGAHGILAQSGQVNVDPRAFYCQQHRDALIRQQDVNDSTNMASQMYTHNAAAPNSDSKLVLRLP